MSYTHPKINSDVLTLIHQAAAFIEGGDFMRAEIAAKALTDAGFRSAAADIKKRIRQAGDEA